MDIFFNLMTVILTVASCGSGGDATVLTPEEQIVLLNAHNAHRRQASTHDMNMLKWNSRLADMAETWAQRCVYEHGFPDDGVGESGFESLGQNLLASSAKMNYTKAVRNWWLEHRYYHYNSNTCAENAVCGHYLQVVWASTTDVGCATVKCTPLVGVSYPSSNFLVCNYGPGGNYNDERPFII